ncbi:hypothetical protein BC835DRAFT_85433 [Cytidiella melzeri]|nr:hypothetical protein BC835DRAFT_85433 [Cytidiella melzeri]
MTLLPQKSGIRISCAQSQNSAASRYICMRCSHSTTTCSLPAQTMSDLQDSNISQLAEINFTLHLDDLPACFQQYGSSAKWKYQSRAFGPSFLGRFERGVALLYQPSTHIISVSDGVGKGTFSALATEHVAYRRLVLRDKEAMCRISLKYDGLDSRPPVSSLNILHSSLF